MRMANVASFGLSTGFLVKPIFPAACAQETCSRERQYFVQPADGAGAHGVRPAALAGSERGHLTFSSRRPPTQPDQAVIPTAAGRAIHAIQPDARR